MHEHKSRAARFIEIDALRYIRQLLSALSYVRTRLLFARPLAIPCETRCHFAPDTERNVMPRHAPGNRCTIAVSSIATSPRGTCSSHNRWRGQHAAGDTQPTKYSVQHATRWRCETRNIRRTACNRLQKTGVHQAADKRSVVKHATNHAECNSPGDTQRATCNRQRSVQNTACESTHRPRETGAVCVSEGRKMCAG